MSEHLSLRIALLDQQMLDAEDRPIGRVDDLELAVGHDGGVPTVEAILTGAEALGDRLGGAVGRGMAAVAARLRPRGDDAGPARIPARLIAGVEPMVTLVVPLRDLPHVARLERWLAHHLVERLPGAGDARD